MTTPMLRCAVYTRKSSEEGLDMAFNSLDAQRDAGRDYIKSQKHQGWKQVATSYDDGGYSGGSTQRPALRRLIEDIEAGRIDVVVVYKVDRLSRSLSDFANLMQLFDEHKVSFVSVTQQFNTTSSMGRLTLNMLLSFAQFEREVSGERVRDKIAATAKRGIFVCGQPPLGYRRPGPDDENPDDRRLRVVPEGAEVVRKIFRAYIECGSYLEVAQSMNSAGHTSRAWVSSRGRSHGGKRFNAHLIYRILNNPVYIGKIAHTSARMKGAPMIYQGLHEAVIDQETWDKVQSKMVRTERGGPMTRRWSKDHLLQGKLRTFEGHAMSPSSSRNRRRGKYAANLPPRRVRYYCSQKATKQGFKACPIKTVNATYLDDLIRGLLTDHLSLHHGFDLRRLEPMDRDLSIRDMLELIVIAPKDITIRMSTAKIATCIAGHPIASNGAIAHRDHANPFRPTIEAAADHVTLTLTMQLKLQNGRRVMVSPDGQDLLHQFQAAPEGTPADHIIRAIGMGFRWREEMLRTGETADDLGKRCGIDRRYVRRMQLLTRLSPKILRAALTGTLGARVDQNDLLRAAEHLDWSLQAVALNQSEPTTTG